MNIEISKTDRVVAAPKITLLMVLCGIVGMAGTAAAAPEDDAPHLAVHYSQQSLGTDSGARTVYHRIVRAAENVCPQPHDRFLTVAIQQCRTEAIERAVHDINSPRLAAVHSGSANRG